MMLEWGFPDASAEVERLRVENEKLRIDRDAWRTAWEHANKGWRKDFEIATARADRLQAERDEIGQLCLTLQGEAETLHANLQELIPMAEQLRAERDDLAARLQSIQQAERDLTRAKLDTAKAMRKGEAI